MKRTISRWTLALACSLVATNGFAAAGDDDDEDNETASDKDQEQEEETGSEESAEKSSEEGSASAAAEASVSTDTPSKARHFFIGARVGYAIPMGKAWDLSSLGITDANELSDYVSFQV